MKKLIALTALFALSSSLLAGEGWMGNIEKALEIAKKEKKQVLIDFTGSDWCPPCIALKKNVFDSKEFKAYAKDNLVLVELDFPRRKKIEAEQKAYNRTQQKKYGIRGFPTVILLDAKGKELLKSVGYRKGPVSAYINKLKDAKFQ